MDTRRKVVSWGTHVDLPLRNTEEAWAVAQSLPGEIVEGFEETPEETPLDPHEKISRLLSHLSPEEREALPRKWKRVGDVLILKIPPILERRKSEIARSYAEALHAQTLLEDVGGIEGEFRSPKVSPLWGDLTETLHIENGVLFRLDPTKVMWSPGNTFERTVARSMRAEGEFVVDLFAGIGYFSIPLALGSGASRVVAIEKNPTAYSYLVQNVLLNRVSRVVEPILGDNRQVAPRGVADRVLLGYVGRTFEFLDLALEVLKPQGGILHYHDTVGRDEGSEGLLSRVRSKVEEKGRRLLRSRSRVVKSFAPCVLHVHLELLVGGSD